MNIRETYWTIQSKETYPLERAARIHLLNTCDLAPVFQTLDSAIH